jgi:bifunctional UDP-N-acetylglucosamine pyrophosphorylase / glucosamine-1-phosphate N-acetyltransferase
MKNENVKENMKENAAKKSPRPVTAIILAAGKGTRMKSPLPKVLHPVAGRPMIVRIIEACRQAEIADVRLVIGHGSNLVKAVVEPLGVSCYTQVQQLGTGDAVRSAQVQSIEGDVIIIGGDHPLLRASDLKSFITEFREQKLDLAVVTCKLKKPGEFGRIVRHHGNLKAIVEAKDASSETLKINEVNTGIYITQSEVLSEYLPLIQNHNSKSEYYLTDVVSLAVENRLKVAPILSIPRVAFGVNNQIELSKATRAIFKYKINSLMENGVLVIDPATTFVEDTVTVESGAVLYPHVYLRGETKIGAFTAIEPQCYIVDSEIGDSVSIKANTYIEKTKIHNHASIGPFARLRPDTEIGKEAHVGNFVEMKKVKFGAGAKAGHLSYLGDAEVGERTNIGCGTITCNYAVDRSKYKTIIGNDVFVGSDTQFVAPIKIGDNAVIGSGSTITKDVPARALAVARGKQFIKENYIAIESSDKKTEEEK